MTRNNERKDDYQITSYACIGLCVLASTSKTSVLGVKDIVSLFFIFLVQHNTHKHRIAIVIVSHFDIFYMRLNEHH